MIVRMRLGVDCEVHSFHLAAIPLFSTHSANDVLDATKPVFDAVDGDWRLKQAGCASDGENKMTGVHIGVAPQLEDETRKAGSTDEFIRIWDPCHHLDLALHRAVDALSGVPSEEVMKRTDITLPQAHPTDIHYLKRLREAASTMRANRHAIDARRPRSRRGQCPGPSACCYYNRGMVDT
eukprot:GHVU01123153.1.p1 GENE.GHVU01123153.1~~GHVU01123153.1.p1  ORF type:complete len:180 (+),score=17.34 GHVU01123153.1:1496-2035(+)